MLTVSGLEKSHGARRLFKDVTLQLSDGRRVALVGGNGVGKTTLFRMLVGEEAPDAGTIKIGETAVVSYVDQSRDDLDPDKTVFEEITGGIEHLKVGNREIHGRAYCTSFNFKGTDQQKSVGTLSGGERQRVAVARALVSEPSLLLADEPTGNLDTEMSAEIMEVFDALHADGMTLAVITHDLDVSARAERQVRIVDGRLHETVMSRTASARTAPTPTVMPDEGEHA